MNEELRPTTRRAAKTPSVARHGQLKRHTVWKTSAKIVASAMAVVLVSGVSVAAYAAWDLVKSVKPTVTLDSEKALEGVPDVGAMDGGANILLIGSDSRKGQGDGFGDPDEETAVLNDVTMLLHISQDHSHAEVISFPRDMLVSVPGTCTDPDDPTDTLSALSSVKINSVFSYGGAENGGMDCVVKTVEQLVGVTIPFAGVVQFMGVAGLSEAIGGVDVCVAEKIEDEHTDTYLDPGMHSLSGLAALQFLRTRHGVGDGSDLGRISNQQVFMSALARKLQSEGTLNDPTKLYGIAQAALANMQLSSSLGNVVQMIQIAKAAAAIDLSQIAFIQYPTSYVDGGGALEPNYLADAVNQALQQDAPVVLPADQDSSFASEADPNATDPNAAVPPPADTAADDSAPAADAASESSDAEAATPAPTPAAPPAALPDGVSGQTAADVRCSSGRTLDDQ